MMFPLSFWDVSLLIAIIAIILLITAELLSPHYGRVNLLISKKKLKNAAMAISIIFLVTVVIRIANIV
jgi:hypothetical protein